MAIVAKARDALRLAKDELSAALERRKPEADLIVGDKAATIDFGTFLLGGQEMDVD